MQTAYDGSHSIIFCRPDAFDDDTFPYGGPDEFYGGFHSWFSFGLMPSSRPFVEPPSQKTETIDIPGANGVVDLSNTPLGFATFENRSGSWDFYIAHDITDESWEVTYDKLLQNIHGKKLAVILTDDPSYFYIGRCYIQSYTSESVCSRVTIGYDLYPYKRMIWTTLGDWLWNPFDFMNGVITQSMFKDLPVNSQVDANGNWIWNDREHNIFLQYDQSAIGSEPVKPIFIVSPDVGIEKDFRIAVHNRYKGNVRYFDLQHGTTDNPQIMFATPDPFDYTLIQIVGRGTVSIKLRPGRL